MTSPSSIELPKLVSAPENATEPYECATPESIEHETSSVEAGAETVPLSSTTTDTLATEATDRTDKPSPVGSLFSQAPQGSTYPSIVMPALPHAPLAAVSNAEKIRWPLAVRMLPAFVFVAALSFLSWQLRPEVPLQTTLVATSPLSSDPSSAQVPAFQVPQVPQPQGSTRGAQRRPQSGGNPRSAPLPMPQLPSTSPMAPSGLPSAATANPVGSLPNGAADPAAPIFARGVAAQQAGRKAEAIEAYQEVLKLNPKAVPAYINLAILAGQDRKLDEAASHLQAARQIDRKNPGVALQLAQTYLMLKKPEAALEPLRAAAQLDDKNKAARVMLAQVLTSLNRPREAYDAWRAVASADSKDATAALATGALALEGLRNPRQSEPWLAKAIALAPDDPRPRLLLARALLPQKRNGDAIQLLESGAKKFADVVEMRTMLSDARWLSGDKDGAIAALRTALESVPRSRDKGVPHARLRVAIGRLLAEREDWKGAISELKVATDLLPRELSVQTMLAEALMRSGDRDAEAEVLQKVLSLDANRPDVRLALARALAATKNADEAQTQYAAYLQAQPADARVHIESAALFEKEGQLDRAVVTWARIGKILPDNPLPALERGRLLRRQGKDAQALQMYRLALQLKPNNADALLACAQLEEKTGQSMRALGHWRALIATRPGYDSAYASYLKLAAKNEQLPAAINFLKQQLGKNPERPAAYNAILETHQRQGEGAKGRAIVEQLSKQWPRAKSPRFALNAFDRGSKPDDPTPISQPTPASNPTAEPSLSATPGPSATPLRQRTPSPTPTKAVALPSAPASPAQSTLQEPGDEAPDLVDNEKDKAGPVTP